jgi:hypothetical protein
MLHFWSPPSTLSLFPVNGPLPRFPNRTTMETDTHLQNLPHPIPWKFIFSSESPLRKPLPCSPTGSLWRERYSRLLSHWSIYSFMSAKIPQKGALLQNGEKHKITVHGAPRGQKTYIQWGATWFPKGMLPAIIHYLTAWKFTPTIWCNKHWPILHLLTKTWCLTLWRLNLTYVMFNIHLTWHGKHSVLFV